MQPQSFEIEKIMLKKKYFLSWLVRKKKERIQEKKRRLNILHFTILCLKNRYLLNTRLN